MDSLSLWFLKLALKCIDHLAWPAVALGYPLCASVRAIETDSYPETRDLISYWILFSFIYLFEYTFLKLLQWFQFWPYVKLMIVFWLIIPDFGRASCVYHHLIHSCISMAQAVISRLENQKQLSVWKENFLLQPEEHAKGNGTEGLEKIIASKNTTHNPDVEATNAISATGKKEMQQTDGKRLLHTEHKDTKDLEVVEKKAVPAGKQDDPAVPNVALSQSTSSATVETKGRAGRDPAGGKLPQSSTHKKVQKEWTCALCQVTTQSNKTLKFHLRGSKHRATCEALKAMNQPVPPKLVPPSMSRTNNQSNEELKQKNIRNQHASKVQKNIQISNAQEHAINKRKRKKCMLRCEICNVKCNSEGNMASHLNGRMHLAKIPILSGASIQ